MTKPREGERCRWCGRPIEVRAGPGRPAAFCRPSHRQRDYEARRKAVELGLSEQELVVTREALNRLHDQLYVLECAIEDVDADLAELDGARSDANAVSSANPADTADGLRRALDWLLENARPLVATRLLPE